MCIAINISTYNSSGSKSMRYTTASIDGMYANGSFLMISKNGTVLYSEEKARERAISDALNFLQPYFLRVYGRSMRKSDFCGQSEATALQESEAYLQSVLAIEALEREKEAEQLRLKAAFLDSPTAIWESQESYQEALEATNIAIEEYNKRLADTPPADGSTKSTKFADAIKSSAMIPILIMVGVLAAVYVVIFARR